MDATPRTGPEAAPDATERAREADAIEKLAVQALEELSPGVSGPAPTSTAVYRWLREKAQAVRGGDGQ